MPNFKADQPAARQAVNQAALFALDDVDRSCIFDRCATKSATTGIRAKA
jgi:hypothetical protein